MQPSLLIWLFPLTRTGLFVKKHLRAQVFFLSMIHRSHFLVTFRHQSEQRNQDNQIRRCKNTEDEILIRFCEENNHASTNEEPCNDPA